MNKQRIAMVIAASLLTVAALRLPAQELPPPSPESLPSTTQEQGPFLPQPQEQGSPQQGAQEPGAGAQVHTGSVSGLDTEARLRNLLADHQYARLAAQLDQLPADEAQFYRGILANRTNDLAASIKFLEPLVDAVSASGDKAREKLLRKTLAEDYLRSGDWSKAAQAYKALDARLADQLSADEKDEIEQPLKLLPLAQNNPPMTVEPCDPFVMQVSKNPLGLIDIPVFVDAAPHSLMLDPTAPFNLISHWLAKEVGLKLSEETVTVHTITGRPIQVRMAVIPRFTIGGRLTLRNMTVFVYEDIDFYFPRSHYLVRGVLGYAALSALGSLTVTDNDTIEIQPSKQPPPVVAAKAEGKPATGEKAALEPPPSTPRENEGVPFYLEGDQVLVALGKPGDERIFAIDAGSQQTYLTSRYYAEHADDFAGQKMELFSVPGYQLAPPQPAYNAESVALPVGPNTVHVHYLQVLTQPLGAAARDDVYGVLGVDALDQLKSYTFDYRTMRFSVKPE
jgi:hypothetical protein